jgi:hypothetical protein
MYHFVGSDARRVVTTVKYEQTFRDRAVGQLVGKAMRIFISSVEREKAIASLAAGPTPQPAPFSLINLRPKAASGGERTIADVAAIRSGPLTFSQCFIYLTTANGEHLAATLTDLAIASPRDGRVSIGLHFGTSLQVLGCHEVGRSNRRDLILLA